MKQQNYVAKYSWHKAQTFTDRKKAERKGYKKHKGKSNDY